jgi:hypothetical protein
LNLYAAFVNSPPNYVDDYGHDVLGIGKATGEVGTGLWVQFRDRYIGNPYERPAKSGDPLDIAREHQANQQQMIGVGARASGDAMRGYGEAANQLMAGSVLKGAGIISQGGYHVWRQGNTFFRLSLDKGVLRISDAYKRDPAHAKMRAADIIADMVRSIGDPNSISEVVLEKVQREKDVPLLLNMTRKALCRLGRDPSKIPIRVQLGR